MDKKKQDLLELFSHERSKYYDGNTSCRSVETGNGLVPIVYTYLLRNNKEAAMKFMLWSMEPLNRRATISFNCDLLSEERLVITGVLVSTQSGVWPNDSWNNRRIYSNPLMFDLGSCEFQLSAEDKPVLTDGEIPLFSVLLRDEEYAKLARNYLTRFRDNNISKFEEMHGVAHAVLFEVWTKLHTKTSMWNRYRFGNPWLIDRGLLRVEDVVRMLACSCESITIPILAFTKDGEHSILYALVTTELLESNTYKIRGGLVLHTFRSRVLLIEKLATLETQGYFFYCPVALSPNSAKETLIRLREEAMLL